MTDTYHKFLESMRVGYDQWHDGDSYDLAALYALSPTERQAAEAMLLTRLDNTPDWRDIEALAYLASPAALAALHEFLLKSSFDLKLTAAFYLTRAGDATALPATILDVLQFCHDEQIVSRAIDYSFDCSSPALDNQFLFLARRASARIRFESAARLLNLTMGDDNFWKERPFLLRFTSDRDAEVNAAFQELLRRIGIPG